MAKPKNGPKKGQDQWTINHFSQSNPAGKEQGFVPALLGRIADSIEALGDVDVQDITFSSEVTGEEDDVTRPRSRGSR
jgi:hypothetical protein